MIHFWKPFALLTIATSFASAGVYETLEYGDTKEQVREKLNACERIEDLVGDSIFGSVGLNGTYKIKKTLNDLEFLLYFSWDESGGLKEITLRSKGIDKENYETEVKTTFQKALTLLHETYDAPAMGNAIPREDQISEGSIINSHLWRIDEGSLLLGVAQLNGQYQISIRYTNKRIGSRR